MQFKFRFGITLCLLGMVSFPVLADSEDATDQNQAAQFLNTIAKRTQVLEAEVNSLQAQIKALRAERKKVQHKSVRTKQQKAVQVTQPGMTQAKTPTVVANAKQIPLSDSLYPVAALGSNQKEFPLYLLGETPLVIGGTPVVVSPYLGQRSAFDASDLVVQISDENIDLQLLQERQKIENAYKKAGVPMPDDSLVDISGGIEAQTFTNGPYAGQRSSDIDLTKARLDIAALINKWSTGFLSFDYDNTPPTFGPREANSRLFLNKGFITIGNLNSEPFYGTIGQFFMPFGKFSSGLLSTPFTQLLGQTKGRGILLGFNQPYADNRQSVYGSIFTFRGASGPGLTSPNRINGLGANLDYTFTPNLWNIDAGASVINNLADSNGMQMVTALNGTTITFPGFGGAPGLEPLNHQVPGFNLHGVIGYGAYSITGGYVTASKAFSPVNLAFNGHGAKPQAFHVEGMRTFTICNKPGNFILGYDFSRDALALLIPAQRYITGVNISIWRDTIESLEFRHDINYAASSTASGQGFTVTAGPGHTSDTLTAQIGVYF